MISETLYFLLGVLSGLMGELVIASVRSKEMVYGEPREGKDE